MGKKGFNWKARQVHQTKIDDSETKKIVVEGVSDKEYGANDQTNILALPSSKRKTQIKKDNLKNLKILSKKQRKQLEKIVEKKKKKENRASLLEALAKVQVNAEELNHMTSISYVQSKGLKKNLRHDVVADVIDTTSSVMQTVPSEANQQVKIKTIAGAKKRKQLLSFDVSDKKKKPKRDYNVLGLSESSSDSDEDGAYDGGVKQEPTTPVDDADVVEVLDAVAVDDPVLNEYELIENAKNLQNRNKKKRDRHRKNDDDVLDSVNASKDGSLGKIKHETVFVQVDRDPKIQAARLKLPILGEEQAVVECINNNAIVLIVGETGSGKTTQVPQFLYEAGYARNGRMIGVTEPRRVAAVAMADRVGKEMGLTSREVSYLMRYEGNVTEDTQIKFMTDGVLLKEIESDFILSKYSVIIIDEAHERSVFTDILVGLLSRIVPLRCKRGDPLRLVVMSATLRIEDFTENTRLFKAPPPVVKIEARQFPVTVHFNKKTEEDYLKAAFSKAVKIHTTLPEGGILIFVTGQQEVHTLVKRLRNAFPSKNNNKTKDEENNGEKTKHKNKRGQKNNNKTSDKTIDLTEESNAKADDSRVSDGEDVALSDEEEEDRMRQAAKKAKQLIREKKKNDSLKLPEFDLNDFDLPDEEVNDDLLEQAAEDSDAALDTDEEKEYEDLVVGASVLHNPLWVLPLYSMLAPSEQAKVFQPAPDGCRLCVVATNVAETSLTIPDIKYVVDTGKQKTRIYEKVTGASAMRIVWTSHAGAQQRAGRAGRVAPGHCYRLYSSAVFQHDMPEDREPEIRVRPVDDLLLQMKCMGIDKVVNFPFPTAPDVLQMKMAEKRLEILGALENIKVYHRKGVNIHKIREEELLKVTPLGKAISAYPVLPRYGKMLALSHQHDLFEYTACIVAALSVQEVFVGKKKKWTGVGEELLLGDPGALLSIVGASEHAALSGSDMEAWCAAQGVRHRALKEIRLLRAQLNGGLPPPTLSKPPGPLAKLLRQIMLAGLGDCVARKVNLDEVKQSQDKSKMKYAYHCAEMEEPIFIHSGSVLRKDLPEWVVYQELYEAGEGDDVKMIMRGITAIQPEWLPVYVTKLCNLGEPLAEPPPTYDALRDRMRCHVNATFGRSGWQLPTVEIDFPKTADIFRWFAISLLDGAVVEKLKKYSKSLINPPNTMVKSWAKLQPRTELLFRQLSSKQICTKDLLCTEWKTNPTYLLDVYKKWLPESAHHEVALFWPPV